MIHMNPKIIGVGTSLLVALIFVLVVIAPQYTNPEAKAFFRDAFPGAKGTTRIYKTAYEYMGYGVYVGRK